MKIKGKFPPVFIPGTVLVPGQKTLKKPVFTAVLMRAVRESPGTVR
jgi:hypothetical protein